jgi:hypothetical protein
MKKKLLGILIIFTFAFATPLLSQGPPNPPADPSVGGEIVGGGAPIDGGLGILLGMGMIYGGFKSRQNKVKKSRFNDVVL